MNEPITDTISRTALLGIQDGTRATLDAALAAHAATGLHIVAPPNMDLAGQAALCTAIATAVRAFGEVTVTADADTVLTAGPYRGHTVAQMAHHEGARLADTAGRWPVLHLETDQCADLPGPLTLLADWAGWTARVRPAGVNAGAATAGSGNVLAALAAAALGVHEAFGAVQDRPGADTGRRTITLNLWHPGELADGPTLAHAPARWWLVGLGHLGQANAWVLSWLPYPDAAEVHVVLQDTQDIVPANHSTGLFTPAEPGRQRKTRLVADWLDRLGYGTAIIEWRLDAGTQVLADNIHIALLGVDALAPRRLISGVGWKLALDAGLGAGPTDFNAVLLRRFPATTRSDQVTGWAQDIPRPRRAAAPALADLERHDPCGAVRLGSTAAGAAFVGAITACLTIGQAIRAAVAGDGFDVINLNLQSDDVFLASATAPADFPTVPLIPHTPGLPLPDTPAGSEIRHRRAPIR